jgi:LysR family transcriptional activator of glutamate synthase operon
VEFRQLLAFKTVAEQESFTAAASQLHLTQSAISQQIRALEEECSVLLLERSNRLVRLTAAGQALLAHVERILAQVENARLEMAELAGGLKGRCRIACLPSIGAYFLPQIIAHFQQRYPAVELQLMEGMQAQLLFWVQQGMVDFSIMALPVHSPALKSQALLRDEFVLMVPHSHRLVGQRTVRLADLSAERFVLYPQGAGGRDLFMEACHRAGVEPHITFESNDRETILGLVAAGVGITLMPRVIAHHTRVDGPVMVDIGAPRLFREVGLVWNASHYLPQAARNLMALLREQAADGVQR